MFNTVLNVFVQLVIVSVAVTHAYWTNPKFEQQSVEPHPRYGQQEPFGPPRQPQPNQPMTLGIMMFDNVEVLDFGGPFEVLAITGQLYGSFKVYLIGHQKHVRAMNGLNVVMDYVIGDRHMPKLDVVVLPGSDSNSTIAALNHQLFVPWIKRVAVTAKYMISVCTGVNFLCRAGLANGLDITTHHKVMDLAARECPKSNLFRDRRFTDNGRIFTSAGISAGIDVSLYFVKKIVGSREATAIAERMEYDYKDFDYDKVKGVIPNCRTGCW